MKRIVVLGAAESGAGAAVLAKVKGFDVFVSDMSAIKDKYKQLLDEYHIEWEEGRHTETLILNADEVIEWLENNLPNAYGFSVANKFKQDFGLCLLRITAQKK